jgi:hypothetical protein
MVEEPTYIAYRPARWLPDLSKTRARCGISRPRQYFQRNHSVFLNYRRFAGSHRSLQPNTARLPVQSVPVTIRQRLAVAQLDRARVSVLVPRKAKALHPILATGRKVLNVAGWVYSGYEAYEAGKKCASQIK